MRGYFKGRSQKRPELVARYKDRPLVCVCMGCGKTFTRLPHTAGKFCTRECFLDPGRPKEADRKPTTLKPQKEAKGFRQTIPTIAAPLRGVIAAQMFGAVVR